MRLNANDHLDNLIHESIVDLNIFILAGLSLGYAEGKLKKDITRAAFTIQKNTNLQHLSRRDKREGNLIICWSDSIEKG